MSVLHGIFFLTLGKQSGYVRLASAPMAMMMITGNHNINTLITKRISRDLVKQHTQMKKVSDKLHLSGGAIDLLTGTDFVEAFVDIHTVSGEPGEPTAKINCFGCYVLGQ